MSRSFHVYGALGPNNPHLRGKRICIQVVSGEELAEMTENEQVFVETGIEDDGKEWTKDGITEAMKAQFYQDFPNIHRMGRFWWIPLERHDAVIVPLGFNRYIVAAENKALPAEKLIENLGQCVSEEEQRRIDGLLPDEREEEKAAYLKALQKEGASERALTHMREFLDRLYTNPFDMSFFPLRNVLEMRTLKD